MAKTKVLENTEIKLGKGTLYEGVLDNLEVLSLKGYASSCNRDLQTGIYYTNASTSGIPSDSRYGGILVYIHRVNDTAVQIHIDVNEGTIRSRGKSAGTQWLTRIWK